MKRLPPAKRNQLIGVIVGTGVLIGLVYFMLIGPQSTKNAEVGTSIGKETARLQQIKTAIKQADTSVSTLNELNQQLSHVEADVASGDLSAWTYDTIRRFKTNHVDISSITPPTLSDCDLIPNFPYKQIRFSLTGVAYYHDLGKFIADFENKFPHCRVLNLGMEPAAGSERLNFRVDIAALVKANN